MKENQNKKRGIVPAAVGLTLAAAAAAVLAVNHRAVHMVYRNLTVPKYTLEESERWDGGKTWMGVPYAAVSESQYVDIYVPDDAENPPLYVLIHGGGFVTNDARSRQAAWMYRYFRDHGFAVASVNYRLAQEAAFPAAVEDCKAAIRFLRAHAAEYGYNADRIAVFGESAGGYLAAMCAFTGEDEFNGIPFVGQEKLGQVSSHVDVLVDYYGVMEFGMDKDIGEIGLPQFIYDVANGWASGDVLQGYENVESLFLRKNISECTPEELQASDPYWYLERNINRDSSFSTWIIHGDCDITVPLPQSQRLAERLAAIQGEDKVVLRVVPNMGHASDPLYSDEELAALEEFLRSRLTAEGNG